MKNKKKRITESKYFKLYFFAFLVVFFGISFMFLLNLLPKEPSFTIIDLKNECHNKSFSGIEHNCSKITYGTSIVIYLNESDNFVLKCYEQIKKEVCSQKEVDSMEILKYDNGTLSLDNSSYGKYSWNINCENSTCYSEVSILLKDLTISWLEENCECIKFCNENLCINKEDNSSIESIEFANSKCSAYSCFDKYEVEVKR